MDNASLNSCFLSRVPVLQGPDSRFQGSVHLLGFVQSLSAPISSLGFIEIAEPKVELFTEILVPDL